ncbi:hypothetical protein QE422_003504 [Chryseobacterium sp. SORGH_AS 447]|uniref:hypothetical protein n=1 Tax=Chryseobacterium sp. SORGH_AS_0447 TaxID=3041769 RepID=UPI00277EBADB|nr:hypothetical protein [Chryseobacterium sp. SORGH_AS_0447]MDQ1163136.1 hypothetical protein [Chryseobacterium sp. SORGH_AS_0447]
MLEDVTLSVLVLYFDVDFFIGLQPDADVNRPFGADLTLKAEILTEDKSVLEITNIWM